MEGTVSGEARGVVRQYQDLFDNADARLGLERNVRRHAQNGQVIDSKGRPVVQLPSGSEHALHGPYDGRVDESVTSVDGMIEQMQLAEDQEHGDTYEGVASCMKRKVNGPRRSSSGGRRKTRPQQQGYSARESLRAAERLASASIGTQAAKLGRPKVKESERRVTVSVRVHPKTAALIKRNKRKAGRFIDAVCEGQIAA